MAKRRIHALVILGTRPEAVKLAPVVHELLRRRARFRVTVCATAQHRLLLDQVTQLFRIPVHLDLNLMTAGQTLDTLTARLMLRLSNVLRRRKPDVVIVQGDTTTVLVASLAAFYQRIPVAHVEAGLRTKDRFAPFPEEINRRLTSHLADFHFAPTRWARRNLLREGVPASRIFVTGNTVVDAFLAARKIVARRPPRIASLRELDLRGKKLILVTAHRRENFGAGMRGIAEALARLARREDVEIVYPVHPNPNVTRPMHRALDGLPRVRLIAPLDYLQFVWLMMQAFLVLTDSGGVQEEMPSLGRPVLVMREKTERPEGIEAGVCKLVGTNPAVVVREAQRLLDDPRAYRRIAHRGNPFGDGKAARRIVSILARELGSA